MHRSILHLIQLGLAVCMVALVAQAETKSCPAGKELILGKCFDARPKGRAHDSQGMCTLCAAGYQKNPKTRACEKQRPR